MMPVSMMIAMGMVFVMSVMVIVMALLPWITLNIVTRSGNQALEFASVEPDAPARLADIYGDPITFAFFKSRCVASWADHVHSFHVHKTLRASTRDARSRG